MKKTLTIAALMSLLMSGAAFADDDCNEPIVDWQEREVLQAQLEDQSLIINRIKVDDGCYEVKGIDQNGNRFEAQYTPASFTILELKVKFDHPANISDYLPQKPGK